ncbi:MAG TPA: hypothetical protein ENF95_01160 [Candidatus Aenigmarchaeota archaeon]|nr:hypothetical protein [Candidatus Aenigmarchaeota archaeon]
MTGKKELEEKLTRLNDFVVAVTEIISDSTILNRIDIMRNRARIKKLESKLKEFEGGKENDME